jgi:hypothetical protein
MPDSLITAPQTYYKHPSEVRGAIVDMRGVLRQGEILTGTPTLSATGITTASPLVTTTVNVVNSESIEAGKCVTFTVSAGTDGTDYMILVSCGTSASQTVYCGVIVKVRVPTASSP